MQLKMLKFNNKLLAYVLEIIFFPFVFYYVKLKVWILMLRVSLCRQKTIIFSSNYNLRYSNILYNTVQLYEEK